ncbi:polysaccharide biosynthesis tyrosine autokinase [Caballeronia humi]|uniref:Exopolysaccharide biosynthesis protein n=1 Tax=Caballeronia humi TaxID=326474 RepID=A0A158GQJ5_9BURK|nr:polysaccharide biosynthesis tyrosine autokinase [Caballeronia humi]SAL33700.1 exopolysaccharide biosynthesis protein [Caballeronia humi]
MNTPILEYGPYSTSGNTVASRTVNVWRLLIDNMWAVILIVIAVTALAASYAFLATPTFTADAVVRVEFPNPNTFGLNSRSGRSVSEEVIPKTLPSDAEIQMIQSRTVLLPVIKKYKQDILATPDQFPVLGRISELLSDPGQPMPAFLGMRSFAWGGEELNVDTLDVPSRFINKEMTLRALTNNRYELIDPNGNKVLEGAVGAPVSGNGVTMLVRHLVARPGTEFTVARFSEFAAVQRFSGKLKVAESTKESGVVQISYENKSPELAQAITNSIAQTYIASHVDQKRQDAGLTRDFIESELPRLKDELKRADTELSDYRTQANSMAPSAEASSYLKGTLDIETQIATLRMQRTQTASRFAPGTRELQTIDQQLATLEQQRKQYDSRFNQLPESDRKTADLTRNAKVAEDIYVAMLDKSRELQVTRAGTIGNVHLVDTALYPTEPSKPKRLLVIAGGIVGGLIISGLYIFLRQRKSVSIVHSPDAAEHHLQLPVFGAVAFSDQQLRLDESPLRGRLPGMPYEHASDAAKELAEAGIGDPHADPATLLLATTSQNEEAIEALRAIRTSLMRDIDGARNNVLAVAGATPGIGKTFIASNLAVLHAQAGNRVLLIDGDLRRGQVASQFGLAHTAGLAEVLTHRRELEEVVQASGIPGLSVISNGVPPANPSKLLSTTRLRSLLEQLMPQYDLVIIDTPAVLAVSDAVMVGAAAGSTLVVVRPSAQSEAELGEAIKRLDLAGARVAGAIFNAMPKRRSDKRIRAYSSTYGAPSYGPSQP